MREPISKALLARKYGYSAETMRKLMNIDMYDELLKVGYVKTKSLLSPRVVEKFIELYGLPKDHFKDIEE